MQQLMLFYTWCKKNWTQVTQFSRTIFITVIIWPENCSKKKILFVLARWGRIDYVGTPKDVVTAKLKVGETVSKHSNNVMIGKWKDKREVTYISSEFQNDTVPTTNRKGRETLKPLPIKRYNKFVSGIDRQVQMISYFPFTRETIRWFEKLGIHILQMLHLSSYNLYNQYNIGTTWSLYDFRIIVLSKTLPKPEAPSKSFSIEKHIPSAHGMGEICGKYVSYATKTISEKIVHTTVTLAQKNQVCVLQHVSKNFIHNKLYFF